MQLVLGGFQRDKQMFDSHWYSKKIFAVLAVILTLSGCGGSSNNNNNPPPPPPNNAPTANAGPDQTVEEMVLVTLDGSGSSDSDGTVASYAWTQTAGTDVTLDTTAPSMPTFTSPDVGADETLTFSLVVTDDDGATSAADTVDIMVTANVAPTADAGPDQTVDSLAAVTLDGSASADSDGTIAAYTWTQTTGTAVTLDETVPAMPTFTAPNVGADEVLTFELVVTDDDGALSLPDTVLVTINPTLPLPFSDDFSDGNADGWAISDDGALDNPSSWSVAGGTFRQSASTNDFGGNVDETYHRGTFAVLSDSVNLTNYRFSVVASPIAGSSDAVGVMFRYTDADHYYRFSLNSAAGATRLEKKAGVDINGNPVWQTLARNYRGYEVGQQQNIVVEVDGPLIQVFVNNDTLFAAYDTDHATGGVALFARDGVRFDDVLISTNDTSPEIVIAEPVAHDVIPNAPEDITVRAIARNVPAAGSVELGFGPVLDCDPVTETNPGEFTTVCPNRASGNYVAQASLRDSGVEVDSDDNVLIYVGTQGVGDKYDAIGDSLTLGFLDRYSSDNLSLVTNKTISFQGWVGPLGDMLSATLGQSNLVGNEGIPGDRASRTRLLRLPSILERNPTSNRSLLLIGTNDTNDSNPTPSGLGCVGTCSGTLKGHIQTIVTQLLNSGRDTVYLGILPPVWGSSISAPYPDPLDFPAASRNERIVEYNQVITNELSTIAGVELGPDFFSCFLTPTVNRFSLFEDTLHPNGLGYAFMAALWHDAITGGPVVPPVDPCPSPIYIVEGLDGAVHKQNLLEAGDEYYNDAAFALTNVPSELADGVWITQNNADNTSTDANYMTFDVGANPVTIYIAYDPAGGPPTSSETFAALGAPLSSNLTTNDPSVGTFALVEAAGVTGSVTIGGTMSDLSGIARQGYLVIVVP
jgi:lysophospholipase L1-like esterase